MSVAEEVHRWVMKGMPERFEDPRDHDRDHDMQGVGYRAQFQHAERECSLFTVSYFPIALWGSYFGTTGVIELRVCTDPEDERTKVWSKVDHDDGTLVFRTLQGAEAEVRKQVALWVKHANAYIAWDGTPQDGMPMLEV